MVMGPERAAELGAELMALSTEVHSYPSIGKLIDLSDAPRRRRIAWQMRIAYMQGDFTRAMELWDEIADDEALRIYLANCALAAAVTGAKRPHIREIFHFAHSLSTASDATVAKTAQLALVGVTVPVGDQSHIPQWLERQDLSNVPPEMRPIPVSNWVFLQHLRGQYQMVRAIVDNTLNLQTPGDYGLAEIQMRIIAAEASWREGLLSEAVDRMAVALELAVPASLTTIFADRYRFLSDLLTRAASRVPGSQAFLSHVENQAPLHDANWIAFLNTVAFGWDQVEVARELTLTGREIQAAQLAAGELTFREIARQLGVTEAHLRSTMSRVYRKLGIAGRAELQTVLTQFIQ